VQYNERHSISFTFPEPDETPLYVVSSPTLLYQLPLLLSYSLMLMSLFLLPSDHEFGKTVYRYSGIPTLNEKLPIIFWFNVTSIVCVRQAD